MVVQRIAYGSVDERKAAGKQACKRTPPSAHAEWRSAADRLDPVALLEARNFTQEPDDVPVRHGRMMASFREVDIRAPRAAPPGKP